MRTALVGTKQLGLDALTVLRARTDVTSIVTMDDRNDSRSRFKEFLAAGARVVTHRHEAAAEIAAIDADIVLIVGWYWLLGQELLSKSRFLGIHHSLLPEYRGGSPLVWALIEGQETVGTTIFELTAGADEGPMWAQARVPVGEGYIGAVAARCDNEAIRLLPRVLEPNAHGVEQQHARATWRPQRHPRDGLIDWHWPARRVERWVRAQSRPYPGAFAYAGSEKVVIWRARATEALADGPIGTYVQGSVVCGDGRGLQIEESSFDLIDGILLSAAS